MLAERTRHDAVGEYVARRPSFFRRLTLESFDALPSGHNMIALVELDVTRARKAVRNTRRDGGRASLFAYLVRSIARALSERPELNAIRGRGRIYEFREIDVNIPLELESSGEKTPRPIVIRNAAEKTTEQIHAEIHAARLRYRQVGSAGTEDRWVMGLMRILLAIPKPLRAFLLRRLASDPVSVKRNWGTTMVSSVSMLGVAGFAIPYLVGTRAACFALGGVVRKPVATEQGIQAQEILSLTAVFNHDIVDGAPAARFIRRLKAIVENPEATL